MAGLGRIQQRFNAAVVAILALAGLNRMADGGAADAAQKGYGHPLHAKLLKGKLDGCPAGFHLTHRRSCAHYTGRV